MTEAAGTEPAPSRAAPGEAPVCGASDTLLIVVEPDDDIPATLRPALVAAGLRLADRLGAKPHVVTWPGGPLVSLDQVAAAVAGVAQRTRPAAVILADSDGGRQLAPLVAHRLQSGAIVGCSDVLVRQVAATDGGTGGGMLVFVKPVYGGWLEREITSRAGSVPVATLDLSGPGAEERASVVGAGPGSEEPEMLQVSVAAVPAVRRLEWSAPDPRSVDLVHAERIVGVGAGAAAGGLRAAAEELAELLGGSMGATRPVVDDGLAPRERLIGQTGRTVAPRLYLALGISGSPHHMAGVRAAGHVVSIDRDERAPIFQLSDAGYVADLDTVLPALVQKIKEWRDAPRDLREGE